MGIAIQGDAHLAMPQHLTHNLRMNSLLQEQGCRGMAQIVKANTRQPCLFQQGVEPMEKQVGEVHRAAQVGAEDQVIGIISDFMVASTCLDLTLFMGTQRIDSQPCQADVAT